MRAGAPNGHLMFTLSDGRSISCNCIGGPFAEAVADDITKLNTDIERLLAALKPFADAVYNDNGDMTVSPAGHDDYIKAYFVMRERK